MAHTPNSISRRQLLFGDIRGNRAPIRPPWALEDSEFTQVCSRCGECQKACPSQILICGSGGFPEVNFALGGCDFCGQCLQACRPGALKAEVPAPSLAWSLIAVIGDQCLSAKGIVCRACGDNCEVDAIHFQLQTGGRALPILDDSRCNGCGFCVSACVGRCIQVAARAAQADNESNLVNRTVRSTQGSSAKA